VIGLEFLILPIAVALADAGSGARSILGFGAGAVVCYPQNEACKKIIDFDALQVVRYGLDPIQVLGVSDHGPESRLVALWQSSALGKWDIVEKYSAEVVNAFAIGNEVATVNCKEKVCTILVRRDGEELPFPLPDASPLFWRTKAFSWHHDSQSIIFPGPNDRILRIFLRDGATEEFATGTHSRLSTDGKKLAVLGRDRIDVLDMNSGHAKAVAKGSMWKGSLNQVFFWSSEPSFLYVNYESGYLGGDGYRCVRINLNYGREEKLWTGPIACSAEVITSSQ